MLTLTGSIINVVSQQINEARFINRNILILLTNIKVISFKVTHNVNVSLKIITHYIDQIKSVI